MMPSLWLFKLGSWNHADIEKFWNGMIDNNNLKYSLSTIHWVKIPAWREQKQKLESVFSVKGKRLLPISGL